MDWQPMEMAPRDGAPILVTEDGGEVVVVLWHDFADKWGYQNQDFGEPAPIAWMPLPTPYAPTFAENE